MAKTAFLKYTIWLTDKDQLEALAGTDPTSPLAAVNKAPSVAAVDYSAPLQLGTAPFRAPCITSEWFSRTDENFPVDERTFDRCEGGWFGVCFLFGTRTHYFWRGVFALAPAIEDDGSPVHDEEPVAFAKRRWIDGFELPASGEGASGTASALAARGASRHLGGYGLKIDSSSGGISHQHAPLEAGVVSSEQWERFYIRIRRYPAAAVRLHKVAAITGTNNGLEMWLNPSGAISFFNVFSTGSDLLGTSQPIPINVWKKIDSIYRMGLAVDPVKPFWRVYLNGASVLDIGPGTNGPLNTTTNIGQSTIGTTTLSTCILDVDDWMGAALPLPGSTVRIGTTTNASTTISALTSTEQIRAGDAVSGTGIPVGATVSTISGAASVVISSPATASGSVPITFSRADRFPGYDWNNGSRMIVIGASQGELALQGTLAAGSAIVTELPMTTGLVVGMTVAGLPSLPGPTPEPTAAYVAAIKAQVVAMAIAIDTPCGCFEITKRVAWGLRHEGWGLKDKPTGTNCGGYGTDVLVHEDGTWVDILHNSETDNDPVWNVGDGPMPAGVYRLAINPGDGGTSETATILSIDGPTQITLSADSLLDGSFLLMFQNASGFAADHGAWVGDWRLARQRPADLRTLTPLTSSTPGAVLSIRTDAAREVDGTPGILGIVAMRVACYGSQVGALVAGALGYKLPGGADVNAPVTQAVALGWVGMSYLPDGIVNPISPLSGLELKFTKNSSASQSTVRSLFAVVEAVGAFYEEDLVRQPEDTTPAVLAPLRPAMGIHNAPYPRSPWARKGPPPIAPVLIYGGLYTGNSTFQDLIFRHPIHFLWVRNVTDGTGPWVWFSSANGGHDGINRDYNGLGPAEVLLDPSYVSNGVEDGREQQTLARIAGADAQNNLLDKVYQVIAIGDPGLRFFAAGALHCTNSATDFVTPLDSPTFTPEAVFLLFEGVNDATVGLCYKGMGHAAAALSALTGAENANGLAMGLGQLTYKPGISISSLAQTAYLACRRNDGSGDPGMARVLQLATYVGDGSALRTVGLTPCGRRPMFAIVTPHNAASFTRDPSHTGTTSHQFPGTLNGSTGIVAGAIDTIQVGLALNAVGIVYDVFVIPGTIEACNNGWSCNGDIDPVPPTVPTDPGGWDDEPDDPDDGDDPDDPGNPPPPPGITGTDFGAECKPWSTLVINQALSKIGISQPIGDVVTEASPAAEQARMHYADVVTQVLRDVPWPFATKYATLALLGGTSVTPLNPDWRYSYRRPADCVFERRLAVPRTGAVDPTPPPFQLSSDTAGGLLLTNRPGAVLEYTFRPNCSAATGDPLFREALIWKLAGVFAPALSRMVGIVEHCEKQYQEALVKATLIIRPGNPGEEPLAGTLDQTGVHARANVDVVNRGLVRIGARTIANLVSEQSREAQAARAVFEAELRSTLRDHPWAFATAYIDPVLVGGTATVPVNDDWTYSYRLGPEVVFVRRIVKEAGKRTFQLNPPPFRLARDGTGGLLLTDEIDPQIEVTVRVEGTVAGADDLFREALAWRLAASLAPSLALIDPARPEQEGRGPDYTGQKDPPRVGVAQRAQTARFAWGMYGETLRGAKLADAREQHQPLDDHLPDWLTGRD